MPYKLLALDMDSTLLTSQKSISPATRDALERLAARGVALSFCTGRNFPELLEFPAQLPFVRYAVLTSGAVVYDFATQQTIHVQAMSPDVVLSAIKIASIERSMPHVMGIRESVARPADIEAMPRYGMGVYQAMFRGICTQEPDLASWVQIHPGQVAKLNLYHETPEARDRTRRRLEESGLPLTLADSETTSVECSAKGVNKGEGLRLLAAHLGMTLEDAVAIGDSDNDAAALKAVAMPVAMGNATTVALELSRMVVADNDHDGIVEAIERLF